MSAGSFVNSRYEATYDPSMVHPIRVQPETLDLTVTLASGSTANEATTVAINNPISASVSKGRRAIGLNARLIRVKFTGTLPTGYLANSVITLPAINPNLLTAPKGATGTYLGVPIEVVGTSPETVR